MKDKKGVYIVVLLASLMMILFFNGCQKAPINGDLDGRWQILEIQTNNSVIDVKDQQLFYNFYMHVCNLSFYGGIFTEANLTYENDMIYLNFPYIYTPGQIERLSEYGIYTNPVEFHVSYLDKKKLIMKNDESIITLRKF